MADRTVEQIRLEELQLFKSAEQFGNVLTEAEEAELRHLTKKEKTMDKYIEKLANNSVNNHIGSESALNYAKAALALAKANRILKKG